MKKTTAVLCLSLGMLLSALPAFAESPAASVKTAGLPALTLEHWKNSAAQEQTAFLFGFVTALDMEKEWQGDKPLPIGQSTASSWIRGLSGVSLEEMRKALDEYAVANPADSGMHVVEALGRIYVRPHLTEKELRIAGDRVEAMRRGK